MWCFMVSCPNLEEVYFCILWPARELQSWFVVLAVLSDAPTDLHFLCEFFLWPFRCFLLCFILYRGCPAPSCILQYFSGQLQTYPLDPILQKLNVKYVLNGLTKKISNYKHISRIILFFLLTHNYKDTMRGLIRD